MICPCMVSCICMQHIQAYHPSFLMLHTEKHCATLEKLAIRLNVDSSACHFNYDNYEKLKYCMYEIRLTLYCCIIIIIIYQKLKAIHWRLWMQANLLQSLINTSPWIKWLMPVSAVIIMQPTYRISSKIRYKLCLSFVQY